MKNEFESDNDPICPDCQNASLEREDSNGRAVETNGGYAAIEYYQCYRCKTKYKVICGTQHPC